MRSYLFFLVIFTIILVGSVLFVPKISTRIFPFQRKIYLHNFLETTKKNNSMNARSFWIFREYYSPGYFIFKEKGLTQNEVSKMTSKLNISFNRNNYIYPFATYHSTLINSLETLTNVASISGALSNFNAENGKDCIINQPDAYLCPENEKKMLMIFVKPMNEMQRANGFFDYKRKDLAELTKGKHWLVISEINL